MLAYKRPKNLQDYLVSSTFTKDNTVCTFTTDVCNRSRCSHCKNINIGSSFTSHVTGHTYNLRHNANCASNDVIYLITCKRCNVQYVGQTSQSISKRMNSHRFDICNFVDPAFSTTVATHFNLDRHSIDDFSFMPIDNVNHDLDRLCKETFWIHKLKTLNPDGLNTKLLYNAN